MKNPLFFLLGLLFSLFSWQGTAQSYCPVVGAYTEGLNVTHVIYAGISKRHTEWTPVYNDYTNYVAYVHPGETNQLEIWVQPYWGGYLYAYIDWNKNGIFNDEGEVYYFGFKDTGNFGPHRKQILVPENATLGNTRMRVSINDVNAGPCDEFYYGEVEDYTVNITPVATSTFLTTWTTTTANETITIPTNPSETYSYSVSWENNGVWQNGFTGNATHTFPNPGTYTVAISGTFPAIYFNYSGDMDKIQSIEQWGTNPWTTMSRSFLGCSNLISNATDTPNLSGVTTMEGMFAYTSAFNGDIGNWDVSTVTNMKSTFEAATAFNQNIGSWDVSNVTLMRSMFAYASVFNQDISGWNVANVTAMDNMFFEASAFNQNIGSWNVGNVIFMYDMFFNATNFNQNLGDWDVRSATSMQDMFAGSGLSTTNYDLLLNGWRGLSLQNGVTLDVGSVQYCDGSAARTGIIADFGWTINDGGLMVGCDPSDYFITTWKTDNPGTSNNTSIEITTAANEVYNYDVNWGDGSGWQIGITGNATHTYATAGTYTVSIRGTFPRILFETYSDREKILSIEQWGTNVWTSMERAFFECANLVSNASDAPNLSAVTTTERMFERAFSFNGDLSAWDVSNITNMGSMFNSAIFFNATIGSWNVSNVTNMAMMFSNATSFNQDISSWDVSSVTQMNNMFFNTPLSTANYDALLNEWSTLALQNGVTFDVGGVQYCTGLMARATIIADFGWTINDGGAQDGCGLSGHFITTWKTDNAGTSNATSITIPTHPDEVYTYDVDWGDGNGWETGFTADATHTYTTEGTYTVSIRGTFPRIYFNNAGDKDKILSIEEWGTIAWTSMESAFYGCANLVYNAFDAPNLSAVANAKNMFRGASSFNGNLSNWDMSSVSNMAYIFSLATVFNGNISTWNVSNVTNMEGMFNGAFIFNSDISNWDVSNVTHMNSLFNIALAFNRDISAWDVSNVTSMNLMFSNAQAFNQDIGNWDVRNVNDMSYIFSAASNFNQYIGNWDVSNVTNMGGMFYFSSGFDQDLSNWDVSNVVDMSDMFAYTSLSRINYDLLLNGWSNLTLQNGVNFSAGSSQYCEGLTARARIIANFGWNITDGGQEEGCIMGDYFITTWQTTTPNESITIPTTGSGYDYSIDWGDGTVANNQTGNATHSYAAAGVYTVKILGDFPRIYFNNSGDRLKIKSIEQWGSNAWSSMEKAFYGCSNLVSTAIDAPNLSGVTSMASMFANVYGFNGDISSWNVSAVTNMSSMFYATAIFNEDISSWDVSNVTDMSSMFSGAAAFNQNIGSWDVSNVTTMANMFEFALTFNQDIGGWNVANVTEMNYMFANADVFNQDIGAWNVGNVITMVSMFDRSVAFNQNIGSWNVENVDNMTRMFMYASVFNQDISSWNVSNVRNMNHMFENAFLFNQDISNWDVSNVTDMSYMFSNAVAFDQNLGGWNVQSVINMEEMFFNIALSTSNYDALLNGWSSQALQLNVSFDGGNSTYCAEENARDIIINTFGWTIIDNGLATGCDPNDYFITTWTTTTANESITIPTHAAETYLYDVSWENNGVWETGFTGNATHTYATPGTYTVAIKGSFPAIYFNNSGDKNKIQSIEQWGAIAWTSMENAFFGCSNLVSNASDAPDLSGVTSTENMFRYAYLFNGAIGNWDVSNITNMNSMFSSAAAFNQDIANWNVANVTTMDSMFRFAISFNGDLSAWDVSAVTNMSSLFLDAELFNGNISTWDVSSVTDMSAMFQNAISFNQNLGSWDVRNVVTMGGMFAGASIFNQNIGSWNVGNVVDMSGMFGNASAFNQNIGGWNVSNVTDFSGMFYLASSFNQDIGSWDVSNALFMQFMFAEASAFNQDIGLWNVGNVTQMDNMFNKATVFNQDIGAWNVANVTGMFGMFTQASAFDQDLSNWNVSNVTLMNNMFTDSALSTTNYDLLLNGWSNLTLKNDVHFGIGSVTYCNGFAAREAIISNFGWTITDGGAQAGCDPSQYFITTWKTDNLGISNSSSINITTHSSATYNYDVDWGDGNGWETGFTGDATHTYATSGTYTVTIRGMFPRIYFSEDQDNKKLLSIEQWGTQVWTSMENAFYNCSNVVSNAVDTPNLSAVPSMKAMFQGAYLFNGDLSNWDVSTVTDMSNMFAQAYSFNGDISTWDVSNVVSMDQMFSGAIGFNQDIGNWDVSNVTTMNPMFYGAQTFNQDIGSWDVGNVTTMESMFAYAGMFNQDIGGWNVSNVTDLSEMFYLASSFNQNIGSWDVSNALSMQFMFAEASVFNQDIGLWNVGNVSEMDNMFNKATVFNQDIGAWNVANVTDMFGMFTQASAFDQDLSNWDVSNVTHMNNMFTNSALSTTNYDLLLNGWSNLTLKNDVHFGIGNVTYCNGFAAREAIISNFGWTITDGGAQAGCDPSEYFITTWKTDNPGASNSNSIIIPTHPSVTYNYDVDWGDGNGWETGFTGNATHTYLTSGTYTVAIRGAFPRIYFNNAGDKDKILSIEQWSSNAWTTMVNAFSGCTNLVHNAIDAPNLSSVSKMMQMFQGASSFNGDLSNWDVSTVTDMRNMFALASSFNGDISTWNVSNVTNMQGMFGGAISFNGNISNWDVSNVSNMKGMFNSATAFNGDISTWDVSNVTNMETMFTGAQNFNADISNWNVSNVNDMNNMFNTATAFNGDISTWDVSNVTSMIQLFADASSFNQNIGSWDVSNVSDMDFMFANATSFNQDIGSWNVSNIESLYGMFSQASAFNQDISGWNVSNVVNMDYMFHQASAFNHDIGNWNVSNVTDMSNMFNSATAFNQDVSNWNVSSAEEMFNMFTDSALSTTNYDLLLNGWSNLTLQNGVYFSIGNIQYCAGEAARARIIADFGWTIIDGGQNCDGCLGATEYTALDGWSNGAPDNTMIAIFSDDYDTILGSIDACSIEIKPEATVTVSEGTTIQAENDIIIDGNLIFLSSELGNGELATMGTSSTITGNATVQRYMKNKRSYRMVSSAVTTPTSIHDNWQEGATSNTDNPNPGFGTHITGTTTDQINGFDGTITGNSSMFTVNVAAQMFEAIGNTDVNTLTAGEAYLLFVRGDRSIDLSNDLAAGETVLRATGSLVTGTQTQNFPTDEAGNVVMFGNPYQSAVNMNTVLAGSTNLNTSQFYVYDSELGDHGAYVTVLLPGGGNTSESDVNQFLQPGQGGQVATLAAGVSAITFNESDKAPGNFTNTSRNPMSINDMLTVQLYTTENFNNGGSVHDSFGIVFAEGNDNSLTPADAIKPMNFYENLGIDHNGTYLSLEQRALPQAAEVYPMYTTGYTKSDYTLKVIVDGLEANFLYLDDHFTGTTTLLDSGDTTYSFVIDANNPLSIATDRFSIRTEQRLEVDDNSLLAGIRLFPNPLNGDTFYINAPKLNGEQFMVSISDLTGRSIIEQTLECRANTVTVPMGENIASGVYMVTLKHGGESSTYRLIKE